MPPLDSLLVFPRFSHISSFMRQQLHWLPFTTRIELKVLFLVLKTQRGSAPKYLCDHIRLPISASSLRPLRSSQRNDLFVPRVRTTMVHTRSFVSIIDVKKTLTPRIKNVKKRVFMKKLKT